MVTIISGAQADMSIEEFGGRVAVYRYRPSLLADQKLHIGMADDARILPGVPWYLRPSETDAALFGMGALGRLLVSDRVPGLDFTGAARLTLRDIEELFSFDIWSRAETTYRFRILKLGRTRIDDRAMGAISRLRDLEVLELGDRITDKGVSALRVLQNLKVLTVSGSGVTDASAPYLAELRHLQRLGLRGTMLTDRILPVLQSLALRQIDLSAAMTDGASAILSTIPTLEQIDGSKANLTASGLKPLALLPQLHTLFLGASWKDADAPALISLKSLKRLDLTGSLMGDAGAAVLEGMPMLEEIALTDTRVTENTLEGLGRLPRLRYLEMSGTRINLKSFRSASGFQELQVLSISAAGPISVSEVRSMVRYPKLHTLLINGVALPRRLMDHLRSASAPRARILEWLVAVAEAAPASDAEVEHVLEVASLTDKQSPRPFAGFSGLKRIHEAESSLEEVVPAVANPAIDTFQESEKNFLGEITINAAPASKIKH